jgi:hypothetical protein
MTDAWALLARERPGAEERSGRVEVLIGLERTADDERLRRLHDAFGLDVTRVIDDTVIGSVPGEHLAKLRSDSAVRDVELSRPLRQHGKPTS